MARSIPKAFIDLTDKNGRIDGTLIICPINKSDFRKPSPILEATREEMEVWGEERIQLLENARYEYEIKYQGRLQIKEIEGIVTLSKVNECSGIIEPGSNVGLLTLDL